MAANQVHDLSKKRYLKKISLFRRRESNGSHHDQEGDPRMAVSSHEGDPRTIVSGQRDGMRSEGDSGLKNGFEYCLLIFATNYYFRFV